MITPIIIGLLCSIAVTMSIVLVRMSVLLNKYKFIPEEENGNNLPTVSVCIPARNETHAMTECLERVLASDYEKLEIIVLDDSSVDDTSVLIKSFAHAGVRFVEGSQLPDGWLGKNHALNDLLKESSSKYVLFLDVDTTLQSNSIRQLISWTMKRDQGFVSVLPQRADGLRASVFLGTSRYFWILFFDGRRTPATSSTSWLVDREKLVNAGGFAKYKDNAQPEMQIAVDFNRNDGTQLLISNPDLGINYEKKWRSQVETSIRLLKPIFGGAPNTLFAALILAIVILLPIVSFIIFLIEGNALLLTLAAIDMLLITLLSLRYFKSMWRYGWWLGAFHWPIIGIQEAILMVLSVIKYLRGSVTWKGRPMANPIER
jgi:glycosyltransferase involved in cell wall biosynthesis